MIDIETDPRWREWNRKAETASNEILVMARRLEIFAGLLKVS